MAVFEDVFNQTQKRLVDSTRFVPVLVRIHLHVLKGIEQKNETERNKKGTNSYREDI